MTRPVTLLVCGERFRRDDGAAIAAVQLLPPAALALAEVAEVGQLDVETLMDVPDDAAIVLADAALGVVPGQVVTLTLDDVADNSRGGPTPASTHSLSPEQVLGVAAELRGSMPRGLFVGIGAADFGYGEQLSPAVAGKLDEFAEAIAEAIHSLAGDAGRANE